MVSHVNGERVVIGMMSGINKVLIMKIILTLLVLCFISPVKAESSEVLLLLTKYKSSKYIKDKSYVKKDGGMVLVPSTFSVKFKVLKPLQTEKKFNQKTITFLMDIESDYLFKHSEEIVLVVKKIDDDEYQLLDWDTVSNAICIDKDFIPEEFVNIYFDHPFDRKALKDKACRFIPKIKQ